MSTFKRSSGTRFYLDVVAQWAGRTTHHHALGTPALDQLGEGVSIICFSRTDRARWRQGLLDVRLGSEPVLGIQHRRRPSPVVSWTSTITLVDDDAPIELSLHGPDRATMRSVALLVDGVPVSVAVPRKEFPLLSLALRAHGVR